MAMIGLRTPYARHIEDRVRRLPAIYNAKGYRIPLCGVFLKPRETQRKSIPAFAPAIICPRCIAIARRWYSPDCFVSFDCVQRWRLLHALDYDLKAVA